MSTTRTVAVAALATAAATVLRPQVSLREDVVVLPGPPDEVIARLRNRLRSDDRVLAGDEHRAVCRFDGRAGVFPYHTIEVVTFELEAVTFEHLRGPFASCHERFDLSRTGGGSVLTHSGTFRLRGGLWTWPLAVGPVKRAFEHHVRTHLEQLRDEPGG